MIGDAWRRCDAASSWPGVWRYDCVGGISHKRIKLPGWSCTSIYQVSAEAARLANSPVTASFRFALSLFLFYLPFALSFSPSRFLALYPCVYISLGAPIFVSLAEGLARFPSLGHPHGHGCGDITEMWDNI